MATPKIVPRAAGEGALGDAAYGWGGAFVTNTTTSSTTQGGKLVLAADDGAVMADTHRLGVIEFAGAEDTSSTLTVGARIEAVAEATWSASENGGALVFYTTDDDGSQGRVCTMNSDQEASFAGRVYSSAGPVNGLNYRTIYVDAGAMVPTATNGAAAGTEELASNDVMVDYFAFDTTTDEKVQFKLVMPEQWDAGVIRAKFYWKSSNTDTGDVAWFIQAVAHADSGALDTAFGAAVSVHTADDVGLGTDNDLHITNSTTDMTVAGTPAEGEMVMFQIYRDVSADNYNADAHLVGVNLQYRETSTASAVWATS